MYFSEFVCFVTCQLLSPAIVYQFLWLILVLSGFLLHRNNLNQFCLSARHPANETLQPQIPLQQHKATWQFVLRRKCASHFSDMAFEGISSWLSLVKMLFFQLSYQWGGWPSGLCAGKGGAIRINYRLLPLSKKSCWWLWQGCVILSHSLSHIHTHFLTHSTEGYNYYSMSRRHVLDVNRTK